MPSQKPAGAAAAASEDDHVHFAIPDGADRLRTGEELGSGDMEGFYDEDMYDGVADVPNLNLKKRGSSDFDVVKSEAMTPEGQSDWDPDDMMATVSKASQVRWAVDRDVVKVKSEVMMSNVPSHGHWVPQEIINRRISFQDSMAMQLGGRRVILAGVHCILVEPQGLVMDPEEYVSAGLVIGVHGQSMTAQVMEEWDKALRESKMLDAAMSFLLPDVQEEDAPGFEVLQRLINEAVAFTNSSNCVLVGKGWGAHRVAELGASQAMTSVVSGVVLTGPGGEPPAAAVLGEAGRGMLVPCMVLWSNTDRVAPYGGRSSSAWNDALSAADAPLVWRMLRAGGHNINDLFRQGMGQTGSEVLRFIKVVMLLHWLQAPEDAKRSSLGGFSPQSSTTLLAAFGPPRAQRLLEELPSYIAVQLGSSDPEEEVTDTVAQLLETDGLSRTRERLATVLTSWLHENLQDVAEAG